MDLSEDAWSYSYPSSIDSLPLPPKGDSTNQDSNDGEVASNAENVINEKEKVREGLKVVTEEPKETMLESPIELRRDPVANEAIESGTSPSKSNSMSAPQPALIPRNRNSSNMSQQSLVKSAPADPHTTIHDVESIPADNLSNSSMMDPATDLANLQNQSPPSTPTQSGNFFNNMISTLSFNKSQNGKHPNVSNHVDENGVMTVAMGSSHSRSDSNATPTKDSPNMLSYRRDKKSKKRNTSIGSLDSPRSPLVESEKPFLPTAEEESAKQGQEAKTDDFDKNNYVDEKFKNTNYRYATITKNNDFHKLFKSIPPEERLLDDFSCALSREILLQGRLYVTEKNICFNSNLLGWVTNLVIPYSDIRNFEKTATAGLFPNGIAIQLNNGNKHYFASFLSRESTYNQLTEVWQASDDQVSSLSKVNTDSFQNAEGEALVAKNLSLDLEKYDNDEYQKALLSIDGDTPAVKRVISESDDYDDDDDDDNDSDESSEAKFLTNGKYGDSGKLITSSQQVVYKLKDTSVYSYTGPYGHGQTTAGVDYDSNKEMILAEENIKCSPGLLFEILYGVNNDLTLQFLGSQGGSEFSKFSDYEKNERGKKERNYNYTKALNYSIGPKSTKCYVQEELETLDYDSCINVLSTTRTPDVPSGNAFNVKTRHVMTWGPGNTTNLVISFKVDWTGSSWVKGMIDKSCLSGQEEATRVLVPLIRKIVAENTFETEEEVKIEDNVEEVAAAKREQVNSEAKSISAGAQPTSIFPSDWNISLFNISVIVLLLGIFILQLCIFISVRAVPEKTFSFGLFNEIDKNTESALFKGEEMLLWNWIDERAGNLDLSKNEKTSVLKNDIDQVITKWVSNELNSEDSKKLLKSFEHHLNSYSEKPLNNMKDDQHQQKAAALRAAIKALL